MMSRAASLRLVIVAAALVALEIACRGSAISDKVLVAPSRMMIEMVRLLVSGELLPDLKETFSAVGAALCASVAGGVAVGLALHAVPVVRHALEPYLGAYYAIPHFAFYPLLVVIFGLGALPLVLLASLFSMVVVIAATLTGLDRVPRVLLKTARLYRMTSWQSFWSIRLPAALPHLLSGVKLAVSYSFIAVIGGEFIMSTAGLGHQIALAYDNFQGARMYGLIVLVLIITVTANMLIYGYERMAAQRRGA